MKPYFFFLLICSTSACAQPAKDANTNGDKKAGGPCECCEAIYEQAPAFEELNETDTLPGFDGQVPHMLVYGTIYKNDGKTPAPGIVLYIYHTDQTGHYTPNDGQTGCAKRNGHLRGWVKTNNKGEYFFYTQKPAPYPNANIPAHIHPIVKEPGYTAYYLDEYRFDDDPLLTKEERGHAENRGGSGIVKLTKNKNGQLLCKRDLVLGEHIPGY